MSIGGAVGVIHSQSYWLHYDGTGPGERKLEYVNETCRACGKPLTRCTINTRYYTLICDNDRCYLFGQPQRNIPKEQDASTVALAKYYDKKRRPGYIHWLSQKRINYRILRDLAKLSCKEATAMSSNKQTKFILEQLGLPCPSFGRAK